MSLSAICAASHQRSVGAWWEGIRRHRDGDPRFAVSGRKPVSLAHGSTAASALQIGLTHLRLSASLDHKEV